MTQAELLQMQLEFALRNNHDIKRNNADFPGYWLLIIEEQLSKADRAGILSNLKVSAKNATLYKMAFARVIGEQLRAEEERQP